VRALLERLSPERVAPDVRARLVLVHGLDDRAVPYTESLRLAAARPARTRVVLVRVLDHVEPGRVGTWPGAAREFAALVLIVYGLARS
jgi:DMSO/TMAO reductase YedYZ molybdopterin-dependent catalytic subunit